MGTSTQRYRARALDTWLLISTLAVIHIVCWSASRQLRIPEHTIASRSQRLWKRSSDTAITADEEVGSYIPYLDIYYSLSPQARPFGLVALVVWLCFLFSFVGIVASDYFCPNLSTISSRLGLSESVAGVTFLGLGNGSPDVFSTFAAMKANTGPLAIGELIGAASFIVSVVAGSMTLIRPFRVPRHSFLRDVGFFTLAVVLLVIILWDEEIVAWEAAAMVGLYVIYVAIVAVGSWWLERQRQRRDLLHKVRSEYAEDGTEAHRIDDPDFPDQPPQSPKSPNSLSLGDDRQNTLASRRSVGSLKSHITNSPLQASPHIANHTSPWSTDDHEIADEAALLEQQDTQCSHHHRHSSLSARLTAQRTRSSISHATSEIFDPPHSHSTGPIRPRLSFRPSLLGAIEFRDIVRSLGTESRVIVASSSGNIRPRSHSQPNQALSNSVTLSNAGSETYPFQTRPGRSPTHSHTANPGKAPWDWGRDQEDEDPSASVWRHNTGARDRTSSETPPSDEGQRGALVGSSTQSEIEDPWRGATPKHSTLKLQIPSNISDGGWSESPTSATGIPQIVVTNEGGAALPLPTGLSAVSESGYNPLYQPGKRKRMWLYSKTALSVLFPSLTGWRAKSWLGRFAAVISAPAIFVLNLTLPVVEDDGSECHSQIEKPSGDDVDAVGNADDDDDGDIDDDAEQPHRSSSRDHDIAVALHSPVDFDHHDSHHSNRMRGSMSSSFHLPPSATSPLPPPLVAWEGPSDDSIIRVLSSCQCTLAPLLCVVSLLGQDLEVWYIPVSLGIGLLLGFTSFKVFENVHHKGRLALCFVGFLVAMVWILTIVTEVVGVLRCIGHVFGLSDAILGLTIFAMGNSLGDLVANVTIARMGFPVMAMSACFGGPMLNVLLGIGISSSYIIASTGQPFRLDFSPTLMVSAIGLVVILVATLILVSMNGFLMSRTTGMCLIVAYVVILTVNVVVEIKST